MSTRDDVEHFLREYKTKMGIWDLLISSRDKNRKTMLELEILYDQVKDIINGLEVGDYSEGPVEEIVYMGTPMWIFGKKIKGKDIYIKLSFGPPNSRALCISFHEAERKMNFPFQT